MMEIFEYESRMSWLVNSRKALYLSIDKNIQNSHINTFVQFIFEARKVRDFYVSESNEINTKKCLEIIVYSMALKKANECLMSLKKSHFHKAWDFLIDAQQVCQRGIFSGILIEELNSLQKSLLNWESTFFPKQTFQSIGLIVKKAICSICKENVINCTHEEGKLYLGRLCYYTYTDIEIDHVSIVEFPDDKKCRVRNYTSESKVTDKLTFEVVDIRLGEDRTIKGVLASTKILEL